MWENPEKPHRINLATQFDGPAHMMYLQPAIKWLADSCRELEIIQSIAIPMLGCGLGGLK